MNDNEHFDLLEFGRPPRRRIAQPAWRVIVAAIALLAVAGAIAWATNGSAPARSAVGHPERSRAATGEPSAIPLRTTAASVLRAGPHYGYGSEDAGPTFWLEFNVLPPSTTLTAVTASVAPIAGLTNARVFFYRPADGKIDVASGTFGAHASIRTLTAGVGFTAVVIWTPTCTAMPPLQEVAIHVTYTTANGSGTMDLIGAPEVTNAAVNALLTTCVRGPR
jgi:hypothetical protein